MGKKIAYGVIASILALVVGGCRAAGPAPERVYVEAPAGVQVEKEISVLDTSGHRAADYATIERLVKGERGGAAPVLFQMDLSRRDGVRYHVDQIVRGGMPTGNRDLDMEIYPIRLGNEPPHSPTGEGNVYRDGGGIRYDRDRTFRSVTRLAVTAYVLRDDTGYRLRADRFAVALEGNLAPGVEAILRDLVVDEKEVERAEAGKMEPMQRIALKRKKATWFLVLEEIFPWREGRRAGRRQLLHEIGRARVDGVLLRSVYVENATP